MTRVRAAAAAACLAALLVAGGTGAEEGTRPEIVNVTFLGRLTASQPATVQLTFRAPGANVVAVIQIVEDLDGSRRTTSQRQVSVVAAAFGFEQGDLLLTIEFATPGRKRLVLSLLTDEREESERERLYIDVEP